MNLIRLTIAAIIILVIASCHKKDDLIEIYLNNDKDFINSPCDKWSKHTLRNHSYGHNYINLQVTQSNEGYFIEKSYHYSHFSYLYYSNTNGQSWRTVLGHTAGGGNQPQDWVIDYHISKSEYVYVLTEGNSYYSPEKDRKWYVQLIKNGSKTRTFYHVKVKEPKCLFFPNPQFGFLGGKNYLMKYDVSSDSLTEVHSSEDIIDLFFPDPQVGYAITRKSLLKSDNGGDSWKPILQENVRKIFFRDNLNGFVSTASKLLRTNDGGITWQTVWKNFVIDFSVGSDPYLFVLSSTPSYWGIYKSKDNGQNWTKCFTNDHLISTIGHNKNLTFAVSKGPDRAFICIHENL